MNAMEYASVFQSVLDEKLVEQSTTGWMETNSGLVQYNGGRYIKIANIVMDGLADYDRGTGYKQGGISLKYDTYKMEMDRGRSFILDAMDVNENNFVASAGAVTSLFQREQVVPEVDSYRYSKIAQIATKEDRAAYGYVPDEKTIFQQLTKEIAMVQDVIGCNVPLIITMSVLTANILYNNDKLSKSLNLIDFRQGELSTKVQSINGNAIIAVPSARLKTKYVFHNGSDNDNKGGFEVAEDAKNINWIISARDTPIAVSKQDTMRIFNPENYPLADAYKIDYRRYHDLWIPKNKLDSIWVSIRESKED